MGSSGRHRRDRRRIPLHAGLIAATGLAVTSVAGVMTSAAAPRGSGPPVPRAQARTTTDDAPRTNATVPHASRQHRRRHLTASRVQRTPTPEATETVRESIREEPRVREEPTFRGTCDASFYEPDRVRVTGQEPDSGALTAAHRSLPLGTRVRVTNTRNDRSVVVRVNDRGPFVPGRCLDLSTAAMRAIGGLGAGVVPVRYEVPARG